MEIVAPQEYEEIPVIFLDLIVTTIGTYSIVVYKGRDTFKETPTEFKVIKQQVGGTERITIRKKDLIGWSLRDTIVRKALRKSEDVGAHMRKLAPEDLQRMARELRYEQEPGL